VHDDVGGEEAAVTAKTNAKDAKERR